MPRSINRSLDAIIKFGDKVHAVGFDSLTSRKTDFSCWFRLFHEPQKRFWSVFGWAHCFRSPLVRVCGRSVFSWICLFLSVSDLGLLPVGLRLGLPVSVGFRFRSAAGRFSIGFAVPVGFQLSLPFLDGFQFWSAAGRFAVGFAGCGCFPVRVCYRSVSIEFTGSGRFPVPVCAGQFSFGCAGSGRLSVRVCYRLVFG